MTKKLEEFFNVDANDIHTPQESYATKENENVDVNEAKNEVATNLQTIRTVNNAIDKIDVALPTIRDLEASDDEMDALANLAEEKFQDLMDLGMNVEPRFSGIILQTASQLLGHSITAKTAKMDKKLKMVQLQLQKARLDHQIRKDSDGPEDAIDGTGVVIDRATLLNEIIAANKNKDS